MHSEWGISLALNLKQFTDTENVNNKMSKMRAYQACYGIYIYTHNHYLTIESADAQTQALHQPICHCIKRAHQQNESNFRLFIYLFSLTKNEQQLRTRMLRFHIKGYHDI